MKSGLRPAHDVHHRLRWGGDLPLDQIEVVVLDRQRGPIAMPLLGFEPGGRIPWSRVLAYRVAGEVVWDREARIDRVLGSGIDGSRLRSAASSEGGWTWDGVAWVRGGDEPKGCPVGLRALTWNVLFDRYDQALVRTSERHPRLIAELRDADADLIGLQEVERPFLDRLLGEPWVRRAYSASDGPEGSTVAPYGQLLLSRWPIARVRLVRLDGHKRVLLAAVRIRGAEVGVAVVHLSSDHRQDAERRRTSELAILRAELPERGPLLILGDFNADGPIPLDLDDAWSIACPDDPGYTFDPEANALAKAISTSGRSRRLDRILTREFEVRSARLTAIDRSPLPPSDHLGVLAELEGATTADPGGPDPLTACVIPLPPPVARALEPLRRRYDPNRWRWPPHLTLAHGYVPAGALDDAARALQGAVPSAVVRLVGVELFHNPDQILVVVPDPAGAEVLGAWYRAAVGWAPACRSERPFTPHVTVARLDDPAEAERVRREVQALLPLELPVSGVALWSREASGPMVPWRREAERASLGDVLGRTGAVEAPDRARIRDEAVARLRPLGRVEVVGSEGLGAALPEGDVDLVLRPAGGVDLARLASAVGGREVIADGRTTVRWAIGGVSIDLGSGEDRPEDERDAILTAVSGREVDFRTVLRTCKAWAEARQVGDPAWGFPGGLAWAVAAAATAGGGGPERWLVRTFERLLDPAPIGLGGAPLPEEDLPAPRIYTVDRRAVIRQAIPATAGILREELERAWICASDGDWAGLLRPSFAEEPAVHLDLTDRRGGLGWLRGRARALIAALAAVGRVRPWPRPILRRGGVVRVSISVEDPARVSGVLDELRDRWGSSRERSGRLEVLKP